MPPYRIEWSGEASADIRRLERPTAMRIFDGALHYARTGGGNVEPLHGDMTGSFRLRIGDYRVLPEASAVTWRRQTVYSW